MSRQSLVSSPGLAHGVRVAAIRVAGCPTGHMVLEVTRRKANHSAPHPDCRLDCWLGVAGWKPATSTMGAHSPRSASFWGRRVPKPQAAWTAKVLAQQRHHQRAPADEQKRGGRSGLNRGKPASHRSMRWPLNWKNYHTLVDGRPSDPV